LVIKRPGPFKMESLECRACDRSSLSRPIDPPQSAFDGLLVPVR
jgi:hypothetical protein